MSEKEKDPMTTRDALLLGSLVITAVTWKYRWQIKYWFNQHLIEIVLVVITFFALMGYLIVRRFQKKNEEEIARMRRLSQVKAPNRGMGDYYRRGPNRDGRQ